jgi:hypothetical protein
MAENAFLTAVDTFLEGAGLQPTPASVGPVEPTAAIDLPALVLSLANTSRPGNGLGERSAVIEGALPWGATINLASPLLPGLPTFNLLSVDRRVLTLPHGGLVRATGMSGALASPADITVEIDGDPRTLMAAPATGESYSVDPTIGQLTFGDPLPATGQFVVTYFLGAWEQRTVRLTGQLRIDVLATSTADVMTLSADVLDTLLSPAARAQIQGLVQISATEVGSIGGQETTAANARRRTMRFSFIYEHEINEPDSSGGVIRTVPVDGSIGLPD